MYIAIVVSTMLVLLAALIFFDRVLHPTESMIFLVSHWFVFWGVGIRLGLAGLRQFLQPSFTARDIFGMTSDEALPPVRELGAANFATAVVGLLSIAIPSFTLPIAISAMIFYGVAGVRHIVARSRSLNENVAMLSDLFLFAVLAAFVLAEAVSPQ
jgi:hypothetical protein